MYLTLMSLFVSLFLVFVQRAKHQRVAFSLRPFDLALLGLATYRLGRLAAFDKVTEPLRLPLTATVLDASGTGETVVPRGAGVRRALGELLACPICVGTWIAALLVYGLALAPGITHVFLSMMSAIGVAEVLNAATEALQWTGEAARKQAGAG
jgi:hypothetical protein